MSLVRFDAIQFLITDLTVEVSGGVWCSVGRLVWLHRMKYHTLSEKCGNEFVHAGINWCCL